MRKEHINMKRFGIIWIVAALVLLSGCIPENPVENGTTALQEKNYEEALSQFQTAIEEGKDPGEAYLGMAMVYYEKQDYVNAEEALRNSLSSGGTATPVLYNMMAVCNMYQEQYSETLSNLQLGISLAESNESETDYSSVLQEMKYNEIVCYEKQLNWEMAKQKVAEYVAMYPEDEKAQKEARFLETR